MLNQSDGNKDEVANGEADDTGQKQYRDILHRWERRRSRLVPAFSTKIVFITRVLLIPELSVFSRQLNYILTLVTHYIQHYSWHGNRPPRDKNMYE